jgi:hypothetical protein
MVGTVGLASSAVMWFLLRKYVRLHLAMFAANYVLFMLGVLAILASVLIGGYAGAWTFLYPLPVHSLPTQSARSPTVCLALGGDFAQLQRLLAQPIALEQVRLLSISFDPVHDTPAQLAQYQQRFGDHRTGWLTARPVTADGLEQLKRAFGVTVIPDPYGGYIHNTGIHIVDPQGRLVEILDSGNATRVAEDMQRRLRP